MNQYKIQVYDPPMCCSSGVCGPNVDPELVRFSSDLDWLKKQGVQVERFCLSTHPAEFAGQEVVKKALQDEGNECLPLIIVNGLIVGRGSYPSREKLVEFTGIVIKEGDTFSSASSFPQKTESPLACGSECNCKTPSGNRKAQIMVSSVVLLAVCAILCYKTLFAHQDASAIAATKSNRGFSVAQVNPTPAPENNPKSSTTESVPVKSVEKRRQIGKYLESFNKLNEAAENEDAVFVFIPAEEPLATKETYDVVLSTQRVLEARDIKIGLYSLLAVSPDYAAISEQVQLPVILVATKGCGMAVVSGDVTETKLLQAYMASSQVSGCSSSSCGPGNCK